MVGVEGSTRIVEKETQVNTDNTFDIAITVPPAPPGHPLTQEIAERQFTALAVSHGADATTCGTAANGDWLFKACFEDADFALAFAIYLHNINPAKSTVDFCVKGGGPVN